MNNAERLQQSIAQVNEIKEKLQNKSTLVGGLKINGKLIKAYSNGSIAKGDFVSVAYSASKSSATINLQKGVSIADLSDKNHLAVFASDFTNNYLCSELHKSSKRDFNLKSTQIILETINSCMARPVAIAINENKAIIFHSYSANYQLYATLVSVSDTTITTLSTTQISSDAHSFEPQNYGNAGFLYDTNKVAIAIPFSGGTKYYRFEINEDNTITTLGSGIIENLYPISYNMLDNNVGIMTLATTNKNSGTLYKIDLTNDTNSFIVGELLSYYANSSCNCCLGVINKENILYIGYNGTSGANTYAYVININTGQIVLEKILENAVYILSKPLKSADDEFVLIGRKSNYLVIFKIKINDLNLDIDKRLTTSSWSTSTNYYDFMISITDEIASCVYGSGSGASSTSRLMIIYIDPLILSLTRVTSNQFIGISNTDGTGRNDPLQVYVPEF